MLLGDVSSVDGRGLDHMAVRAKRQWGRGVPRWRVNASFAVPVGAITECCAVLYGGISMRKAGLLACPPSKTVRWTPKTYDNDVVTT